MNNYFYCTDSQGIVISETSQKEVGLGLKTMCDIKHFMLGGSSRNDVLPLNMQFGENRGWEDIWHFFNMIMDNKYSKIKRL